jgi:hypothetical protein
MRLRRLVPLVSLVALGGCSSLRVSTDYAPGTDFSQYKTFTVKPGKLPMSQFEVERVEAALTHALEARGLKRVADGGDLSVFTHFQTGKETRYDTTGYGYGVGYHGWYGGGMSSTTVTEIPTGTFVVDLVDAKTTTMVWRGIANDSISTSATPEERQEKADRVFQTLFAEFPPAKDAKK